MSCESLKIFEYNVSCFLGYFGARCRVTGCRHGFIPMVANILPKLKFIPMVANLLPKLNGRSSITYGSIIFILGGSSSDIFVVLALVVFVILYSSSLIVCNYIMDELQLMWAMNSVEWILLKYGTSIPKSEYRLVTRQIYPGSWGFQRKQNWLLFVIPWYLVHGCCW